MFEETQDCLVVAGAGFFDDKEFNVSRVVDENIQNAKIRIVAAVDYVYENPNILFIVFSGGGKDGKYESAEMKEYFLKQIKYSAIEKGVTTGGHQFLKVHFNKKDFKEGFNREFIYLIEERRSVDTRENVIFSKYMQKDIERTFGVKLKFFVLSNKLHLERIIGIFKQQGIKKVIPISAEQQIGFAEKKWKEGINRLAYKTKAGGWFATKAARFLRKYR